MPTMMLATIELPDQRAGHAVRRDLGEAPAERGEHQGQRGPGAGHGELAAGGRRLPLDLRDAAERVEQDAADRQAEAPATTEWDSSCTSTET